MKKHLTLPCENKLNQLRAAREFCFQYLFHLQLPIFEELKSEFQSNGNAESLLNSISDFKQTTNSMFDDEVNSYIEKQVTQTLKNYDEIEHIISAHLKNWKLARISKVDRTNLLLAVNELSFTKNVPPRIVINEAIEIAKKFGTAESSAFINGILDSIAKKDQT